MNGNPHTHDVVIKSPGTWAAGRNYGYVRGHYRIEYGDQTTYLRRKAHFFEFRLTCAVRRVIQRHRFESIKAGKREAAAARASKKRAAIIEREIAKFAPPEPTMPATMEVPYPQEHPARTIHGLR